MLVALVLAASIGPVAFKAPGGFVITSRAGEVLDTVRTIGGKIPDNLAVSPDGKTWVFTAYEASADQPLLYRAKKGEEPVLLGGSTGYHAHPTFTNDGRWVFFIHHPDRSGGVPGAHGMRAYGQVWKVKLDGSALEQVTKTEGCKLYPDARTEKLVTMTHADCKTSSAIERLAAGRAQALLSPEYSHNHLPRLSADGTQTAFLGVGNRRFSVIVQPGARSARTVATVESPTPPTELAWAEPSGFLLQLGSRLLVVDEAGRSTDLLDLSGVLP